MLTDTATIKYLDKFYGGELPANGLKFTMSLLGRGNFSPEYKATCIIKILYLDDSLNNEYITTEGWKAIRGSLELEANTAYESMPMISQKQQLQGKVNAH